jgi:beta-alanine degradation protein BauB
MDAMKAAPEQTTLIMENEFVRVFDVKFKPGQKTVMHSHPHHVVYALKDGKLKITLPDGKTNEISIKAGQAMWLEAGQHAVENPGKTEVDNVIVELKK